MLLGLEHGTTFRVSPFYTWVPNKSVSNLWLSFLSNNHCKNCHQAGKVCRKLLLGHSFNGSKQPFCSFVVEFYHFISRRSKKIRWGSLFQSFWWGGDRDALHENLHYEFNVFERGTAIQAILLRPITLCSVFTTSRHFANSSGKEKPHGHVDCGGREPGYCGPGNHYSLHCGVHSAFSEEFLPPLRKENWRKDDCKITGEFKQFLEAFQNPSVSVHKVKYPKYIIMKCAAFWNHLHSFSREASTTSNVSRELLTTLINEDLFPVSNRAPSIQDLFCEQISYCVHLK